MPLACGAAPLAAAAAGCWGLARVLRLERPSAATLCVDACRGDGVNMALPALLRAPAEADAEAEVAWVGRTPHATRLRRAEAAGAQRRPIAGAEGPTTWLVTGFVRPQPLSVLVSAFRPSGRVMVTGCFRAWRQWVREERESVASMLPTTKAGIRFHACSGGAASLSQPIQGWRKGLAVLCPPSLVWP